MSACALPGVGKTERLIRRSSRRALVAFPNSGPYTVNSGTLKASGPFAGLVGDKFRWGQRRQTPWISCNFVKIYFLFTTTYRFVVQRSTRCLWEGQDFATPDEYNTPFCVNVDRNPS